MFLRLLWESLVRQRRRKALASVAILLGTTCVTAMLALATTIGDRIHQELAVYGANIVVTPKAAQLEVKIGGVNVKPATGGAYLYESDLEKLKTIFWANNITGVSPELSFRMDARRGISNPQLNVVATGYWFDHPFGATKTGAPELHPWWKIRGRWPYDIATDQGPSDAYMAAVGVNLARKLHLEIGDSINFDPNATAAELPSAYGNDHRRFPSGVTTRGPQLEVVGIVSTGDAGDDQIFLTLHDAQMSVVGIPASQHPSPTDAISRVDISARTKPEDAFARVDPDTLPAAQREIWYCRPYANSIAYQIREAIPGADAQQVRKVEQSEGTVLDRISGLMWLISAAALLAAGFAVAAAMANAILERRAEIGLMRSLGASKPAIALLFYAENGIVAVVAGAGGYLCGSLLAFWLGARIFAGEGATTAPLLNPVLLPIVVAMSLLVVIAGSTPSIRAALKLDPSAILRADA